MKRAVIAGIVCLAFVSINCGKGSRASINAFVNLVDTGNQTVEPQFNLTIYKDDGYAYIPMIIVNSETLATEGLSTSSEETFLYDCIIDWLQPGANFDMIVDYGEGRGQVDDSLPGFFEITEPQSSEVLELNENIDISWGTSRCAGWYWLEVDVDYAYIRTDSSPIPVYFSYFLDTIVYEREFTVPADDLFPDDVLYLIDGDADINVEAYTGPAPKPLAKGNVTGAAVGFFWAMYDQAVAFDVGPLPALKKFRAPADPSARHRQILLDWADQQ